MHLTPKNNAFNLKIMEMSKMLIKRGHSSIKKGTHLNEKK
jgi:hypothetical protein